MADIGRSTAAHEQEVDVKYTRALRELTNWGIWQANIPGGGGRLSVAEYSGIVGLPAKEDQALVCDRIIATIATKVEITVLVYRFQFMHSTRTTAHHIGEDFEHNGKPLTHSRVAEILNRAIAKVDAVYEIREQGV